MAAFARAAAAKARSGSATPVPDSVSITSAPVRTADTRVGRVAYRTIGRGPPLVLITGYSGTMESWDRRFVDALARHHRVVLLDNGGVCRTCASFPGNGTAVPPSRQQLNAFVSGEPKKVMAALFPACRTAAQNAYLAAISS